MQIGDIVTVKPSVYADPDAKGKSVAATVCYINRKRRYFGAKIEGKAGSYVECFKMEGDAD